MTKSVTVLLSVLAASASVSPQLSRASAGLQRLRATMHKGAGLGRRVPWQSQMARPRSRYPWVEGGERVARVRPVKTAQLAAVPAGDDERYWKDGFYTNWTYGKLLEQNEASSQGPSAIEVIDKSKGAAKKIGGGLKVFLRGLLKTIINPMRIPRGTWYVLKHIGHELVHYYQGFKLFCADISTASGLFRQFVFTGKLSWREKRQLNRALADVFRLVPMAVFLLVPLFEFLLPLALKLFPNMLPSQFQKKDSQDGNLKKELKVRLRTAAFLQDTLDAIVKNKELHEQVELVQLLEDVRKGKRLDNERIKDVAHLFSDELALDNLQHAQLASMCKMVGVSQLGPSPYLRKQLRKKLKRIKQDDLELVQEGIDSLNTEELIAACKERGMRTLGLTHAGYRRNLESWLTLSTKSDIPPSLLLLSRAFNLLERNPNPEEALQKAIGQFKEDCVEEILYDAGVPMDVGKKLEVIKNQNLRIKKETEEEARYKVINIGGQEEKLPRKKGKDDGAKQPMITGGNKNKETGEVLLYASASATAESIKKSVAANNEVSEDMIRDIAEELEEYIDPNPYCKEREELQRLKCKETAEQAKAAGAHHSATASVEVPKEKIVNTVSKTPAEDAEREADSSEDSPLEKRLKNRLRFTLERIEKRIQQAEKKDTRISLLDQDHDGYMSQEEIIEVLTSTLKEFEGHEDEAAKVAKTLVQRCGNWAGEISVEELLKMAKEVRQEELEDA
mmetsp:Transcript_567/g.1085  ORF Transcript_567/g.1085 Transcript_567/m.1085 type:complete len:733 (+) Transcript_567:220-2418(+)|eukprot:CAMPEP_0167791360 /NCGR_PEP_ID=MMETSP0111_2-20121227/11896_1 /TAXON_ID=91324 /ORGANISM="Lotharella globosa, Strain CCCM811" /LENGTH=732 /DNA_ID=CAMNT_0007684027 /DNA_START=217 /DNA_END=2415 /DNA_ORIENTATION=-